MLPFILPLAAGSLLCTEFHTINCIIHSSKSFNKNHAKKNHIVDPICSSKKKSLSIHSRLHPICLCAERTICNQSLGNKVVLKCSHFTQDSQQIPSEQVQSALSPQVFWESQVSHGHKWLRTSFCIQKGTRVSTMENRDKHEDCFSIRPFFLPNSPQV